MTTTVEATELAAVKAYMHIDGDDDDSVIKAMYLSAKQYLTNAGVSEPEDATLDPQYLLLAEGLTLWYYDKRDVPESTASDMPAGLRQAITQRKLCGKNAATLTEST